jgi:hypothetical protein
MILSKGEIVTLTSDLKLWTPTSVGTIRKGSTLEIQQVSLNGSKYLVDNTWVACSLIHNVIA